MIKTNMETISIPKEFNYVGVFLTFKCGFKCTYCINKHGVLKARRELDAKEWIAGLNRIQTRNDLPITLSGGEPTCYTGFYGLVTGVDKRLPLDLLTNLDFDIEEFKRNVSPDRFKRDSKYASIRVSYHPTGHNVLNLCENVLSLLRAGYSIGIWGILHPDPVVRMKVLAAQRVATQLGIDFRTKEFLGVWKGKLWGTYRYMDEGNSKVCACKTTEMLVDPAGSIFRCHSDLYANRNPIGHLLDKKVPSLGDWRRCTHYGTCSPCDLKVKYNRFQQMGHCAVEIKSTKAE